MYHPKIGNGVAKEGKTSLAGTKKLKSQYFYEIVAKF